MTQFVTRTSKAFVVVAALLLAFAFLGSRGLWDPDEGRYTNVALTMLDSGDWLDPMRNEDTGHWSKPPMTYWLVAGSVAVFGRNPWAARLPSALAYLACVALAYGCARRLVPGSEWESACVYVTMLLPFVAGQLVTTDFPMAAAQSLAVYGYLEHRFGSGARRWVMLMWAAFALAFMTKGPPALIALLPMLALRWLAPGERDGAALVHAAGVALFLILVLPWFVVVSIRHHGLMEYFLGAEVMDRIASDRFGRNSQWYGWATVYLPTLLVGALPWIVPAWRWARQYPGKVRAWIDATMRKREATQLFIALWVLLPLAVFCVARSRLPLYLLPVFLPLALAIAAQRRDDRRPMRLAALTAWVALLLSLRLVASVVPARQDASAWAAAIRERTSTPVTEVVFVEDTPRYGLHLHLDAEIETLSLAPMDQPKFNPQFDEPLIRELVEADKESGLVYVAKVSLWPELQHRITGYGYSIRQLGTPYHGRVIFEVLPPRKASP